MTWMLKDEGRDEDEDENFQKTVKIWDAKIFFGCT